MTSQKVITRQRIFAREYLRDFNATRAAVAAGYSKKNAWRTANYLLRKPEVKAMIDEFMDEKYMSVDETIGRLGNIARADMGDYVDIVEGEVVVKDWDEIVKEGKSSVVKKLENTRHGAKIELYDASKALEWIGKFHALFTDVSVKVEKQLKDALDLLEENLDKETFERVLEVLATGANSRVKVIEPDQSIEKLKPRTLAREVKRGLGIKGGE